MLRATVAAIAVGVLRAACYRAGGGGQRPGRRG